MDGSAAMKNELLQDAWDLSSKSLVASAVFDDIATFYHRPRAHTSLGFISPETSLNNLPK